MPCRSFGARSSGTRPAVLTPHDLLPVERVDALVPGAALGLDLAEELERLAPFGHRNPCPTLLVPAARVEDPRPMGDERQHARFTVASGGGRARAVAFRTSAGSLKACAGEPRDIAVRLERNEWNGTVEPRLVLRALCEPREGAFEVLDDALGLWEHLELQLAQPAAASRPPAARETCDRRGEGVAGVLGDLLASGEDVLVAAAILALAARAGRHARRPRSRTRSDRVLGPARTAPRARGAIPARARARPAAGRGRAGIRRRAAGDGARALCVGAGRGGDRP